MLHLVWALKIIWLIDSMIASKRPSVSGSTLVLRVDSPSVKWAISSVLPCEELARNTIVQCTKHFYLDYFVL